MVRPTLLQALASPPLTGVLYHLATAEVLPHISPLYAYPTLTHFEQDLDYLLCHYQPVSIEQVLDHIQQGTYLPRHSLLITLDDGLRQAYEDMAPMLECKGIPAVFFVCPPNIDNRQLMYRHRVALLLHHLALNPSHWKLCLELLRGNHDWMKIPDDLRRLDHTAKTLLDKLAAIVGIDFELYLQNARPYMTWEQIRDLKARGFGIGAHSMQHARYAKLTKAEQWIETKQSLDEVQARTNVPYRVLAFPFSDVGLTQEQMKAQLAAGGADLTFGTSSLKQDINPRCLQRLDLEQGNTSIKGRIGRAQLRYLLQRLIFRHRMLRS